MRNCNAGDGSQKMLTITTITKKTSNTLTISALKHKRNGNPGVGSQNAGNHKYHPKTSKRL